MKKLLRSLAMAFSMYSILPAPRVEWKAENMRYAFCFFPLIGVVIGAAEFGWLWLCRLFGVGPGLTAAVATAIPVLLSGGIHLDGFCDTSDALASHAPAERKLEIMKDPHIGAFGVMACVLCLLLTFGLWTQYRFHPRTAGMLALGFVLSRSISGLTVVSMRCAKPAAGRPLFGKRREGAGARSAGGAGAPLRRRDAGAFPVGGRGGPARGAGGAAALPLGSPTAASAGSPATSPGIF